MRLPILMIVYLWFSGLNTAISQIQPFNPLEVSLNNLYRTSTAKTRSISPENPTGDKGKGSLATLENGSAAGPAQDLGVGWKVNPFVVIQPGQTTVLAEISGQGAIQHMWMATIGGIWRYMILKIYWDDEKEPSVVAPMGDFFCSGWGKYAQVSSLAVCVNPGSGFNSYWVMPFRKKAKIIMENINNKPLHLYYQVDYTLTPVPDDAAYFHAQFRRVNPLPY